MRLFVGYPLPINIRQEILEVQQYLRKFLSNGRAVRWIAENNLHLTVVFLGSVDEQRVSSIKKVVADIGAKYGKLPFSVKEIGVWPRGKSPRIVSVNLNHPEVFARLQAELATRIADFAPGMGRLKPAHITIGRVSKKASQKDTKMLVVAIQKVNLRTNKISLSGPLLYRSKLTPGGSHYSVVS